MRSLATHDCLRSSRRIFLWFVGLAGFFAALHVVLHLTWFGPKLVSHAVLVFTDVRCDYGPNTWLSVLAMLWAGAAALRLTRVRPRCERRGWILVGTLFLYLGIDDALTIHEMINDWARQFVGDGFSFPWIKVLLPVFAVVGLLAFRFLTRTLWDDRPRLIEMVSGFACLGTAVGFEILERWLQDSTWRPRGFAIVNYPVVPEEFLEAIGPALLLMCFLRLRESAPAPTADTPEE